MCKPRTGGPIHARHTPTATLPALHVFLSSLPPFLSWAVFLPLSSGSPCQVDGLWGGLIIYDPTQKQFAADAVVTMTDYYHELSSKLLAVYMSPASGGDEPTPYTALLNGLGQGYCVKKKVPGCKYSYVKGVASTCNNPQTLVRFINAGAFAIFNVSVDNHRWAQGTNTERAVTVTAPRMGCIIDGVLAACKYFTCTYCRVLRGLPLVCMQLSRG